MSKAQKALKNIEAQFRSIRKGERNFFVCPYCNKTNLQPSRASALVTASGQPAEAEPPSLCCELMADAAMAVVLKFETDAALDAAEILAEKAVTNAARN